MDLIAHHALLQGAYQYILVLVSYSTKYREALLLCYAKASEVKKLFSWVGKPQEIVMDKETNFTSQLNAGAMCLAEGQITKDLHVPLTNGLRVIQHNSKGNIEDVCVL